MTAAPTADTLFHSRDRDFSLLQKPKRREDSAPLTLLDILPDRTATATEPLDSWRRLGEIKDGIIEGLTIRHEATK